MRYAHLGLDDATGDAIVAQAQADAMYDAEQELGMEKYAAKAEWDALFANSKVSPKLEAEPSIDLTRNRVNRIKKNSKKFQAAREANKSVYGLSHYAGKPGRTLQTMGHNLSETAGRGIGGAAKNLAGQLLQNKYVAHSVLPVAALGAAGAAGAYAYNRSRNKSAADELYEAGYFDALNAIDEELGMEKYAAKAKAEPSIDLTSKAKAEPSIDLTRNRVNRIKKNSKKFQAAREANKSVYGLSHYAGKPGRTLQTMGHNLSETAGRGIGGAAKNLAGQLLQNKYVAHSVLPVAALGAAGAAGAYAYNRSRNKSASLEAEILVDDLYNINFHTAMEQNVAAWREANGI